MTMFQYFKKNIQIVIILTITLSSCDTKPSYEQSEVNSKKNTLIIDVKNIADKSLLDVEKVLSKAENTEKVKGYPCNGVDCKRAYFKNGTYEIIFKENKAFRITINNTADLTSDDNAIEKLGLPASPPSFKNSTTVIRWSNVEGLYEISFFTDYILIQVSKP